MRMQDELQQKQNDGSGAGKLWSKPELKVLQASPDDIENNFGPGIDGAGPSSSS
jgi:hypothetical protein